MVSARRQRRRALGACAACALAVAVVSAVPAAAATWYEDYADAEAALDEARYADAVRSLEAALAARGESGARVRTYGMNFIPYFPYLRLGIARYHLGEHDAALLAFEAEERLGAIHESREHLAELERFRRLSREANAAAAAERRDGELRSILAEAGALEGRGDLDGAISALGRAASIAPDDADVTAALARLRTKVARIQRERDLELRARELLADGARLLESGELAEGASVLARADSLRSTPESRRLLERARTALADELRARQDAATRRDAIATLLERARRLDEAADVDGALDALQTVLALDPAHDEARRLQARLLEAQARAEASAALSERARTLLDESAGLMDRGDVLGALVAANRVLALDPDNGEAYRRIALAYDRLRKQHVDAAALDSVPPIVRILPDLRELQLDDGRMAELVHSPEFRFGGDVLAMPVGRLRVFDQHDALIYRAEWTDPPDDGPATEGSFARRDFGVRHVLSPGLTAFRIEAVNDRGRSVSREYLVVYDPPLARDWRLYAALVALGGIGAGLLVARRARRRRQLLTRRFNPYIAGAPVLKDELFFGRERLLERVLQTLHNNSILLYGERRIGKTSFQHHLRKRLKRLRDPDFEFHPVFTDLQGVPQERFFATLAEDVFEQLAVELGDLSPHPSLHEGDGYDYPQFVRDMRAVLKRLNGSGDRRARVVLLIDEVDTLNDYDPRVNQKLRALFMRSFAEDLAAVVSGVGIKKRWESEGSPWYNFFEEIRVEPFRREDAEELIRRPVEGIFRIDPDAVDHIIRAADCRPYPIQKICIALVDRMHAEGRTRITVEDVRAVAPGVEA